MVLQQKKNDSSSRWSSSWCCVLLRILHHSERRTSFRWGFRGASAAGPGKSPKQQTASRSPPQNGRAAGRVLECFCCWREAAQQRALARSRPFPRQPGECGAAAMSLHATPPHGTPPPPRRPTQRAPRRIVHVRVTRRSWGLAKRMNRAPPAHHGLGMQRPFVNRFREFGAVGLASPGRAAVVPSSPCDRHAARSLTIYECRTKGCNQGGYHRRSYGVPSNAAAAPPPGP